MSHLTSSTHTTSNFYVANSLASAVKDQNLYRPLMFHMLNFMSHFHCLGRAKGSVKVWGLTKYFVTWNVLKMRIYQHHPQTPNWRTTPFLLSVGNSLYSQPHFISGGRSSIRNLVMLHSIVTGTHLSRLLIITILIIWYKILFIYSKQQCYPPNERVKGLVSSEIKLA